jgi:hypothetical protein
VSQQLDVLCDSSQVLAPARLEKLREIATARELQHQLAYSRWRKDLESSEAARQELCQQLAAARARLQQL